MYIPPTYFMLIDVQWPEVGIEEEFIGLHIYRWLSPPLCAHVPLGINKAPEAGSCESESEKPRFLKRSSQVHHGTLSSSQWWPLLDRKINKLTGNTIVGPPLLPAGSQVCRVKMGQRGGHQSQFFYFTSSQSSSCASVQFKQKQQSIHCVHPPPPFSSSAELSQRMWRWVTTECLPGTKTAKLKGSLREMLRKQNDNEWIAGPRRRRGARQHQLSRRPRESGQSWAVVECEERVDSS